VILRSHAIVSSEAFLCGASHDYNDPNFTLIHETIELKPYSWICSRASVNMGCTVGEGAVLALGAVAVKDLKPWTVYGGVPAKEIGTRTNFLKGK
jgi:putative colanic acid biosynthesis acetyltransferase WcaF